MGCVSLFLCAEGYGLQCLFWRRTLRGLHLRAASKTWPARHVEQHRGAYGVDDGLAALRPKNDGQDSAGTLLRMARFCAAALVGGMPRWLSDIFRSRHDANVMEGERK